jgi:hypothetical protein
VLGHIGELLGGVINLLAGGLGQLVMTRQSYHVPDGDYQ